MNAGHACVQLEALSPARLPELQALLDDPLVAPPAGVEWPFDARLAQRWLQTRLRMAAEGRALSLVAVQRGRLCGAATLHGLRWRAVRAEIGFWVGRPFWGHGLGAEIVSLAVEAGVLHLGLACIDARCRADNAPAQRVLTTLGFARTDPSPGCRDGGIVRFRWRRA